MSDFYYYDLHDPTTAHKPVMQIGDRWFIEAGASGCNLANNEGCGWATQDEALLAHRYQSLKDIVQSPIEVLAEWLWRDSSGRWHKVYVDDPGPRSKMVFVEYFDNNQRYTVIRHGRLCSHGTRKRICVWRKDVRLIKAGR